MKKKLLVLSLIVICIAILAAGTLAYFTGGITTHNVITTGGVEIDLIETGEGGKPFPEEGVAGVMPGDTVAKQVTVKNTGKSEAWVRLKLDVKAVDAEGSAVVMDDVVLKLQDTDFTVWIPRTEGQELYYYYASPLAPGETTPSFINEVEFLETMDNRFQGCTFSIDIIAQAVQTANNGTAVTEALGWPEV